MNIDPKIVLNRNHERLLGLFLDNCLQHNKSPKTLINYQADLKKYLYWVETVLNKDVSGVAAKDISHYLEFMNGNFTSIKRPWFRRFWQPIKLPRAPIRLSPNSKRRHLSTINNFYQFLQQSFGDNSKKYRFNPVKNKIHYIKVKEVDIFHTAYLTDEDWAKIWDLTFRVRDKLILSLMYYAGLRLEEVVNLDLENFDFQNHGLKFKRKGGYIHELQPNDGNLIFRLLESYLLIRTRLPGPLLLNKWSKRMSARSTYALIMRLVHKAGCQNKGISPHSFRKACATNLYRQTKDLLFVRDYLNHSDAKVTQTYIETQSFKEKVGRRSLSFDQHVD